jgi:hypothetical protein
MSHDGDDDWDRPRPTRRYSCSDRTCGAEDCRTCHPLSPVDVDGDQQDNDNDNT